MRKEKTAGPREDRSPCGRSIDQKEKLSVNMNPYILIGSGIGTADAAALSQRLAAWHDDMVMHVRRLRAGRTSTGCDEDCAHAEARALWAQALVAFGERAHELSFLRSHAQPPPLAARAAQFRRAQDATVMIAK